MLDPALLPAALAALPRLLVRGTLWRTVSNDLLQGPPPGAPAGSRPQPLWPGGAALRGGRYTPVGGCNTLYLAPDAATALAEVQVVLFPDAGAPQPGAIHNPLLVFACDVHLPHVLDLCDDAVQAMLETSEAELTAPWLRAQERQRNAGAPLPPTQALGDAACRSDAVLAFRYPSYRRAGAENLVVFTDHLAALGGRIALHDRTGTLMQALP
jgi:RES domain-containing protein